MAHRRLYNLWREYINGAVLDLARSRTAIKEIVRQAGYGRGLVRRVLSGQRSDVFRVRKNSLELHLPWLDAQWAAGHRGQSSGGSSRPKGGCLRVVTEWATRRRKAEKVDDVTLNRATSAKPSRVL
ncbi:hypothetical protein [Rhizobium mongolense]|uniref:hypothetical protein n=1 Tax=Rhizobium mongolense TaxID=57676 RepID=UPI000B82C456|nr:hypothetical protein [Rhizobium mongolense]